MAVNNPRISLSPKKRFEILRRDGFCCYYCGRRPPEVVLEVDHFIPVAKGGTNDDLNLRAACQDDNGGKSDSLLTDDDSLTKSREILEMSHAEVELLKSAVEWCQELADARRKQKDIIITNLENIAGVTFGEEERVGVYKAFKKFGFEPCADHLDGYIDERKRREERGMKQYTLIQYVNYQNIRNTVDGRVRYFLGVVRNAINSPSSLSRQVRSWTGRAEIRREFIEELIESLKEFHPLYAHEYLDDDVFIEWWHAFVRREYGNCCDHHTPRERPTRTVWSAPPRYPA